MAKLYSHPDYSNRRADWNKWRDLYDGKHEILTRPEYLWLHAIENAANGGKEFRAARVKRTRYLNLVEILVSFWTSYFFRKGPSADDAVSGLLGEAIDDITGNGISLTEYVKNNVLKSMLLYGKAISLVTKSPFEARNMQEYREQGIRPLVESICPLSMPDWDYETLTGGRVGRLNLARYEFELVEPRNDPEQPPVKTKYCHAYILDGGRVSVKKYKAESDKLGNYVITNDGQNWIFIDLQELGLSEIPIVISEDESWVRDAAEEALRYHNLRSTKDNAEYMQGYQKIFISGVDFTNDNQRQALTEYTIMGLPEGANVTTVEPIGTANLEQSISQALDTFFKVGLNQFRMLPTDSRAGQSADSTAAEKSNSMALVESTMEDLENHTNQIIRHWAAYEGNENFDGKVEFPHDVTEQSYSEFIEIVSAFADKIRGVKTLDRAVTKRAASMLQLDESELEEIYKEIDSMPEEMRQPAAANFMSLWNGRQRAEGTSEGNRGGGKGIQSEPGSDAEGETE